MIVQDYCQYEEYLYKCHQDGRTVSLIVESNRLYPQDSYEARLEQARKNGDKVIYVFTPFYENIVEIEPSLALELYGDKPKDSIYTVVNKRQYDVDLMFINPVYVPYMKEIKVWIMRNLNCIEGIRQLDHNQVVRGKLASQLWLSYCWKFKPDYIVACPFKLQYNYVCHKLVNEFGVRFEYLDGQTEKDMVGDI